MDLPALEVDTTALFYTVKGRRVYGGGGIIPDIFVPMDTTRATKFYINCNKKAVQMRFASSVFDRYRSTLASFDDFSSLERWMDSVNIERHFLDYAASVEKMVPKPGEWEETRSYMMPQIKALVGRYSKMGDEAFYRFYLPVDDTILAALKNSSIVE